MSGQTSAVTAAVGAVVAAATAGPLAQVFNELGLLLAVMGAAGGLVSGLYPWRGAGVLLRSVVLGAVLAFGIGAASPYLLGEVLSIDLSRAGNSVMMLSAGAFLIGWFQDALLVMAARRRGVLK